MNLGETRADRILHAGLAGLSARSRVIADNVANVDTPSFKASRVDFEQMLQTAMARRSENDLDTPHLAMARVPNAVAGPDAPSESLTPQVTQLSTTSARADGNNVDIDHEMLELAQTNLNYSALAQLMTNRMQVLRTVINDGRR